MLKAVIFDVDGTLIDSNPLHVEGWRRAFEKHGYKVLRDRIEGAVFHPIQLVRRLDMTVDLNVMPDG